MAWLSLATARFRPSSAIGHRASRQKMDGSAIMLNILVRDVNAGCTIKAPQMLHALRQHRLPVVVPFRCMAGWREEVATAGGTVTGPVRVSFLQHDQLDQCEDAFKKRLANGLALAKGACCLLLHIGTVTELVIIAYLLASVYSLPKNTSCLSLVSNTAVNQFIKWHRNEHQGPPFQASNRPFQ